MTIRRHIGHREGGFTLLEMLLAITAFALIAVIIGGAMRIGYRAQEKGEKQIESSERLRRTADILDSQVESFIPLTVDSAPGSAPCFTGDRKSLTIATTYSLFHGRRGCVIAEYKAVPDGWGKESLMITEQTEATGVKSETLLLTGELIEFSYFEKGLTGQEDGWVDQWTSSDRGPEKVRLRLKYQGREHLLVIPLHVRETQTGADA